jgi:hypothetical protein
MIQTQCPIRMAATAIGFLQTASRIVLVPVIRTLRIAPPTLMERVFGSWATMTTKRELFVWRFLVARRAGFFVRVRAFQPNRKFSADVLPERFGTSS